MTTAAERAYLRAIGHDVLRPGEAAVLDRLLDERDALAAALAALANDYCRSACVLYPAQERCAPVGGTTCLTWRCRRLVEEQ